MRFKLTQRLRLGLLSVLMMVVGGRASAKNENTPGLLGSDLALARTHSDYFEFFHLEPIGEAQLSARGKMNSFKPTGLAFRQVVTVYVETNPQDSIVGIRVVLARSFIEDPQNGIFARDLIKSSLLSAVSATDAAIASRSGYGNSPPGCSENFAGWERTSFIGDTFGCLPGRQRC